MSIIMRRLSSVDCLEHAAVPGSYMDLEEIVLYPSNQTMFGNLVSTAQTLWMRLLLVISS